LFGGFVCCGGFLVWWLVVGLVCGLSGGLVGWLFGVGVCWFVWFLVCLHV
jgi:hypothetical protein